MTAATAAPDQLTLLRRAARLLRSMARPGVPSHDDELAAVRLAAEIEDVLEADRPPPRRDDAWQLY